MGLIENINNCFDILVALPAERSGAGVKHGQIPLLMPAVLLASNRTRKG
jgi:hypothetical protein